MSEQQRARPAVISPLYLKLIQTADMQRVARGISLEAWGDLAGCADRYPNKLVRPTAKGLVGSKVPQYQILDELLTALYGDYRIKIIPGPDAPAKRRRQQQLEKVAPHD